MIVFVIKPLIAIALLTATPSHAAEYIGKGAVVDMPISVKIVANCNSDPKRWCKERKKCCDVKAILPYGNKRAKSVKIQANLTER